MTVTYERLRQIIAEANMTVIPTPTPIPAGPGSAIYTRAIIHALENGPDGCAVQVTLTASQATHVVKRSHTILKDGRRLRKRRIGKPDTTSTYEFTIELVEAS